jgi:hypothetical protein
MWGDDRVREHLVARAAAHAAAAALDREAHKRLLRLPDEAVDVEAVGRELGHQPVALDHVGRLLEVGLRLVPVLAPCVLHALRLEGGLVRVERRHAPADELHLA